MSLTAQQLKSIVEDKWSSDQGAVAFGLHIASPWSGADEVEFDFGKAHIVYADNVFQIRESLLHAEEASSRIVLLTPLRQGDLGNDVVGRLAKSRLFPINHVASLCGLFKAKELDRTICEPAIAQALLEHSPRDGYPPVSAGVLDADTVWRAISRHVFEMGDREPDRVTLLLWATSDSGPRRYLEAPDELRSSLNRRLTDRLGSFADSVLRFVDSGAGADALALAIACQVIYGKEDEPTISDAAVRLEGYHGRKSVSVDIGRELGECATLAVADLDKNPENAAIVQDHLERADALLVEFGCEESAYRNSVSLESFVQRLSLFATEVRSALEGASDEVVASCERHQRALAAHRISRQSYYVDQVQRTKMAVRLVRWLQVPVPNPASFSEQAQAYIKELSFVDWARESVCRGEDDPEISKVYQQLDQAVSGRQREFSQLFAKSLADWTKSGSTSIELLGVESVLSEVVANVVAAKNRVLMIVMDGMSWAVCHEMLDDIRQAHWYEASLNEDGAIPASVIATIPSETKYSRTSLLSGELATGDATTEQRSFRANKALVEQSANQYPPLLFHKRELTVGSRGSVSPEATKAILETNRSIVGVVINAVDDRLANAQQIRDDWSVDRIQPLSGLLRLARDSGRVVVLASDHGHVWHQADAEFDRGKDGSRWRRNDSDVGDGECLIAGGGVLPKTEGDGIIVPWSETIHYKRKQHGYHGGATPQEMVCPLTLLVHRSSEKNGLTECSYSKPEWWSQRPDELVVGETVVKIKRTPKFVDSSGQKRLFAEVIESAEEPPSEAEWIAALLASAAYQDKKKLVRRHVPDDSLVRTCLAVLDKNGGVMTPVAFAKAADLSAVRLDGLISKLKRMLNVDGYEIIDLDRNENKVELQIAKLKRQFDLD